MTEVFLLMGVIALVPFVIGGIVAVATPGPTSRRITYAVVAGILSAIAIPFVWPLIGQWAFSRTSHDSVLLWQETKK
jgi:hypothetical protein